MDSVRLSLEDAHDLVVRALVASNTSEANARSTAAALVAAEADGQKGHGLSRTPSYAAQAHSGKIDGQACHFKMKAGHILFAHIGQHGVHHICSGRRGLPFGGAGNGGTV